ncbi:hypothetical protein H1P_150013 [Hyella patelloides LEGE 07179]|uniref:Uncharacterized protein n=1 Tax=Hyella patelloides LEGE 07179 TaxID=945734 RepID=A0A563VLZ1_9CYAN|nr:hypothetical protein [Hyella patelloides]VEP12449.1 hypothetical protein H1P_150013 [Hyella patelloides LEGE 07179]
MKNIATLQDLRLPETHNTPTATTNNYPVSKLSTITEANQWIELRSRISRISD